MAILKKGVIPLLALIYLVASGFFIWGVAAGSYKIFPWTQMDAIYKEIHAYLTFKEGADKSIKDKVILDHQEYKSKYDISGLKVRDANFIDNGFLLISRYSKNNKQGIVELFSISENRVLYTWIAPLQEILGSEQTAKRARMQHPLLLENGDLIFHTGEKGPLVRINSCSEVQWVISRFFHHSIEMDHNGNLVICIVLEGEGPDTVFPIRDDGVALVSLDGRIIKEYSITDALLKNGYRTLVYGIGPFEKDRIHLNDAQPILVKSLDSDIGDILLSIRNLSTIVLLTPESGNIKWLKTGPWLNQHDINPLEAHKYSVFGNDIVRRPGEKRRYITNNHSDIYIYDRLSGTISQPFTKIMEKENIGTVSAGRLKVLNNGDAYIEESDHSRLIRISKERVRWEYVNGVSKETVGAIHWSRYIPNDEIDLKWTENVTCN